MANYPTSVPSFSNKSAGQTIASADFNSIQDEVAAIGDGLLNGFAHVISSTSGTWTRIKQAMARATSTGALPVGNSSVTILALGNTTFDTASMHAASSNTRLVAPIAGKYQVTGSVIWNANSTGVRQARIYTNGAVQAISHAAASTSAAQMGQTVGDLVSLAANGYVELAAFQDSGSTGSVFSASLAAVLVGE